MTAVDEYVEEFHTLEDVALDILTDHLDPDVAQAVIDELAAAGITLAFTPVDEGPVLSAQAFTNNAQLILRLFQLGWLDHTTPTLDLTYGRGAWWKLARPALLTTNDLHVAGADHDHDFTATPWPTGSWPRIAFDPPYAPIGSQKTSTLKDYNARYGRDTAPRTPAGIRALVDDGLTEVWRLLERDGLAFVKIANYIWSSNLTNGAHDTRAHALGLGFEIVAEFIHVGTSRPQPAKTRKDGKPSVQINPRNNYSVLVVLRKPKGTDEATLFDGGAS